MPTVVTLASVKLAASSAVSWRLVSGTAPYQTEMSVHKSDWPQLSSQIGQPVRLRFEDARGQRTEFSDVYILNRLPSKGPNLVSFVVSDKRWLWPYKLIVRDYNIPRRTGDRTAKNNVPVENTVTFDEYEYRKSSLKKGVRWSAEDAVRDVLTLLEQRRFVIDSFPIKATTANEGRISVQNLVLRDQGDAALSKVLQMIPGAEVYVGADGVVRVFDGADLDAVDKFAQTELPPLTWEGQKIAYIDRAQIRPSEIHLYYQREVEALFDFSDDYSGGTSASPGRDTPFIENVIPTTDPVTTLTEYDPETNQSRERTVPAGTWVEVSKWLEAMNAQRTGAWEWKFDPIAAHWVIGDLEGVLGGTTQQGQNLDTLAEANVMARIEALKQHFRQSFRINRRYMERVRDMQPVRVAVLDPITGARAPACAWSQGCIIPTTKGFTVSSPGHPPASGMYRNVDHYSQGLSQTIDGAPSPMRVEIEDKDIGVFSLRWVESPYGTVSSYIPCNLKTEIGTLASPWRDLADQDTKPMGVGMKVEGTMTGITLANKLSCKAMVTIVPASPNNQRQYLRKIIKPEDISKLYRKEFRIQNGKGPVYSVFVPPAELTARYALANEQAASTGIAQLLGLSQEDLEQAGIDGEEIPGYLLINGKNEIRDHAASMAAEIFAQFADSTMGTSVTVVPKKLKLVGNIASAGITAAPAPSGKCLAVHEFSGAQRAISRIALLPDAVRNLILGILPNGAAPAK